MKKKIFISLATFFFAAITFYNVQVSQENGNISLEHIALMAEASDESGGGSIQKTCYGRGVYGTLGYYYCDGLSLCYWVENADPDTHTGAKKCTP